jgi:hypothetical protein
MPQSSVTYAGYFKEDLRITAAFHPSDGAAIDVDCFVVSLEGDRLLLELSGNRSAGGLPVEPGNHVRLGFWTGWALCNCGGVFAGKTAERRIQVRLTGKVTEKQRREYFRLDVSMPLQYAIPEKQHQSDIRSEWSAYRHKMQKLPAPVLRTHEESVKVASWNGFSNIMPQRINLSGGGIRFRTNEYMESRTFVAINLFLPLVSQQVIHVVAEVLRCNEIVLGLQSGTSYNTAMRFHFIDEADREAIISYIFSEQRRQISAHSGSRV